MANQNNNIARKIVRAKEGFLIGNLLTESDLFNIYTGYESFSFIGLLDVSLPIVQDNRGNLYKTENNTVHVFINMRLTNSTSDNATISLTALPLATSTTIIASAPANIVLVTGGPTRQRGRFEIAANSTTLVIRNLSANFINGSEYTITGTIVYQTAL